MLSETLSHVSKNVPVEVDWKGVILKHPMSAVVRHSLERLQQGEFFLPTIGPNTSAVGYSCKRSFQFFISAAKVYVPVHMISLVFKFRHLYQQVAKEKRLAKQQGAQPAQMTCVKSELTRLLIRYLSGVLRSSLFVAVFASSISLARSRFLGLNKIFTPWTGSWAGWSVSALFAAGILIESSNRWADISTYVFAQWLEAFPRFLLRRTGLRGAQLDRKFALGEKLLLALGMGIMLAVRYCEDVPEQGGKNGKLLDLFIGDLCPAPQTYQKDRIGGKSKGMVDDSPHEDKKFINQASV